MTATRPMSKTRRSSTGSSISSLSLEDTKRKTTSRQSRPSGPSSFDVNNRLSKDTMANIGNRQINIKVLLVIMKISGAINRPRMMISGAKNLQSHNEVF